MRTNIFLQNLRARFLHLIYRAHSGMIVYILSAPTAKQLDDVCKHLRYWPYVKAFQPIDDNHINVLVFVGRGVNDVQWNYYVTHACELMNQCVRQYNALFVMTNRNAFSLIHQYHCNGFLRPDKWVKPFCNYIDEMRNSSIREN